MRLSSCIAVLAAIAAMAVVAGCGGGGSTTSSSTQASAPPASTTTTEQKPSGQKPSGGGGKGTSGSGSGAANQNGQSAGSPAETAELKKQISKEEKEPGDHSIQEFGSEASGEEEEAVLTAMRTFVSALASHNYATVCAGLVKSNREQLEQYVKVTGSSEKSCPAVLSKLLVKGAQAEAKKNLNITVGRVRIGEGSAFVVFRPADGKLSYFVLKEEDGQWKATSLAPGTPLAP